MNIKKWFQTRERWLRYGIIAVFICILLFLFYLFIYFPVYRFFFEQNESDAILLLPTITGHMFPLFSHFIVEGNSLTPQFCSYTKENCLVWVSEEFWMSEEFLMSEEFASEVEENQECVPWTTFEGIPGCCARLEMSPTTACAERVEMGAFWGAVILLVLLYFLIGAGIGFFLQKRKKK
ncbi:MAG: hypothetical protein AABX82_02405 [Nanoarchaeota archaeon]